MKLRIGFLLVAAALCLLAIPAAAIACTTVIVGKDMTADGSVLIAHSEEDSGTVVLHYEVVPPGGGADYRLYSGGNVTVPGPTQGYFGASVWDKNYIPGDFIGGVNGSQVAIYNNMTYSREYPKNPWAVWPGGVMWTEFNLLATMQAHSAREAVQIMGRLSELNGLSCDPGTSFGIADANEGWWINIARGGQWAARRVPNGKAEIIPNCFTIGDIDFNDPADFMWSHDIVGYAQARGWYDPSSGQPLNFAQVYGEPSSLTNPYNTVRLEMVQQQLDAAAPVTPAKLMKIMSGHYEGTEYDKSHDYQQSPHLMPGVRTVCRINTQVSEVTQLRSWLPNDIGAVVWQSMRTPCSGVYVPWYGGITDVPTPYKTGSDVVKAGSAWWAFEDLATYVDKHYGTTIGTVQAAFQPLQSEMLSGQAAFEAQVMAVYKHDPAAARAMLTAYSGRYATQAYETAQAVLAQIAPPHSN